MVAYPAAQNFNSAAVCLGARMFAAGPLPRRDPKLPSAARW